MGPGVHLTEVAANSSSLVMSFKYEKKKLNVSCALTGGPGDFFMFQMFNVSTKI